jgi:hypothetical protein
MELARVIAVIALVFASVILATPKNKIPAAFAGLVKILRREGVTASKPVCPPLWKRFLAFLLTIAAVVLAIV